MLEVNNLHNMEEFRLFDSQKGTSKTDFGCAAEVMKKETVNKYQVIHLKQYLEAFRTEEARVWKTR